VGARLPLHAALALMTYPWDAKDLPPKDWTMPLALEDTKFGGYCFRSGWDDAKDVIVTFRAQQAAPRYGLYAGTFTVDAFGLRRGRSVKGGLLMGGGHCGGGVFTTLTIDAWEERPNVARVEGALPMGGARVLHARTEKDGSGAVSMAQDLWVDGLPWGPLKAWDNAKGDKGTLNFMAGRHAVKGVENLGIRHVRAFAVDYSGASGSPALIAVVDTFRGAPDRDKYAQYALGYNRAFLYQPIGENGFALRSGDKKDGPILVRGTFAPPVQLSAGTQCGAPNLVQARGGEFYFLIMTLNPDGKHAETRLTGQGRDARIAVGGRTVSFDGEKIIWGAG
jgi:hypothetical protein